MTAVKEAPMRLTTSPEVVQWPEPIPSSSSESALCRTTLFMLGRSYTNSSQILRGKIRSLATSVSTKSSLRSIAPIAPAYPSQSNLATCRRASCMKISAVISISSGPAHHRNPALKHVSVRIQLCEVVTMEISPRSNLDKISLKIDGRILFIPIETIYWLESSGNYVEVVVGHNGDKLLVRDTLSSFEGRLDGRFFVRIHRSIIVNVARIREMRPHYTGEYQVTMDNGKQLTLSRGYRFNLKRLMQAYS